MNNRQERINAVLYGNEVPSLYAVLDADARGWWYNRQLREMDASEEARPRERESILAQVKYLKQALANGGYATISQTGDTYTITIGDGHTVQGHNARLILTAYIVGLPVLDFRSALDAAAIYAMPMPVIGDKEHWRRKLEDDKARLDDKYPGAYSYVYLNDYFARALKVGAVIHHAPTSRTRDSY